MKFSVIVAFGAIVLSASVPDVRGAMEIHFSTEEGYPSESSPLDGTPAEAPAWRVVPEDGFLVNGTKEEVMANPKTGSGTALLTTPIPIEAGGSVTISVDFSFTGVDLMGLSPGEGIHVPGVSLGASSTEFYKGAVNVLLGHFPWSGTEYVMQVNPAGQPAGFSAGDIGIEEANDSSDRLRLIIKLTKGDAPDEWSYEVSLLNTTTDVMMRMISAFGVSLPQEFYDSPSVYLNLNRGNSPADHGPATVKFFGIKAGSE